jgi:predicted nucleic acid-binding protein
VDEPPIANSSPLILLARAGHFHLLRGMSDRLLVPHAVAAEIARRGDTDITVRSVHAAAWISVVPDLPVPPAIAAWNLGPGESAILTYAASHPGTIAIIDDLPARRCSGLLGITVRGTLAVVMAAKREGMIPRIKPVVDALLDAGMYLSPSIVVEVLALAGE